MSIKVNYYQEHINKWLHIILRDMGKDNWKPDYVVGIGRGGLIPAVMLSNYLEVPMHSLKVTFREGQEDCESNLWMAEEAFGYNTASDGKGFADPTIRKNILIIDDINDTGRTFNWIKEDWSGPVEPDTAWDKIWGKNVKFATLINNEASDFKDVAYTGLSINKLDNPQWVIFPWEEWWR